MVTVMVFLGVTLVLFGSMMFWVSTNSKQTTRNNLFNKAQAAAESATESVLATMMRDFRYQGLNPASSYTGLVPDPKALGWPVNFQFSDTNGNTGKATVIIGKTPPQAVPLGSQFNGLYGFETPVTITCTATPLDQMENVPATVSQVVEFTQIPVFQFGVFYNMDLEASPGGDMTIDGKVWSNGNIWTSPSGQLIFPDIVVAAAPGQIYYTRNPNDPQSDGSKNNITFLDTTNNPLSGADPLTLPIGAGTNGVSTNVEALLNLPPDGWGAPNENAYSTNGLTYDYNAADLIISNSVVGTNGNSYASNAITVYYQDPNNVNPLTVVPPDQQVVSVVVSNSYSTTTAYDTNIVEHTVTTGRGRNRKRYTYYTTNITSYIETITNTYYIPFTNYSYSFVSNTSFYDYREGKTVQAVQIDVSSLNNWLYSSPTDDGGVYDSQNHSDKGHGINSIYVYNNTRLTDSQLPAVRMTDGAQLPTNGLTVVTPQPMYVKGDYNVQTVDSAPGASAKTSDTTYTYPAALLADAVTILSSSWDDDNSRNTRLSSRDVRYDDTVNAAMVVGIVPSVTVGHTQHFSGGIENYLRLLEDWDGNNKTLYYNGSEVAMFTSQYATNYWQGPGNYYTIPTRRWGYDRNFDDYSKLPPLTPQFRAVIRSSWKAY